MKACRLYSSDVMDRCVFEFSDPIPVFLLITDLTANWTMRSIPRNRKLLGLFILFLYADYKTGKAGKK